MARRDMPYIPEDIVIEILKRLPFRSLVRFQCVSKCWKHFIDSPSQYFINENLHYTKHQSPSLLLSTRSGVRLIDYDMHRREVKYPRLFRRSMMRVIGSCNGLICNVMIDHDGVSSFVFWNPSIGDVMRVPLTESYKLFYMCDCIAFGFDAIANDYKIVGVYNENHTTKVEVYSLQKGSLSEIKPGILENVRPCSPHHITCDGWIFWDGILNHYEGGVKYDYFIVAFDLTTEVFSLIPRPPGYKNSSTTTLSTYEGKLALLSMGRIIGDHPNDLYSFFHVWLLEEDLGSSMERWRWTKKYTSYVFPSTLTFPFTIWGDRFIFRSYRNTKKGFQYCITIINTKDGKMLNIHEQPDEVFVYTGSLISARNMHLKDLEG